MSLKTQQEFRPDYSQPPGAYLEEVLEERGIRKADFAVRCGRPAKTISEIIAGKAAIIPDTALQFERVLDISAALWLSWEANYQLYAARQREREGLASGVEWARRFPTREMQTKGFIAPAVDAIDLVEKLLNFFGVSSVSAWQHYWEQRVAAARFKKSGRQNSDGYAVAAWLRCGDVTAAGIDCEPFNELAFKEALKKVRSLTRQPWPKFRDTLIADIAKAGVAIALIPDLHNLGLRGAAYWASKDKAVIILSDRLKDESRFWFALFHEAMHILLHSKKALFIDYDRKDENSNGEEQEADRSAANFLVPAELLEKFVRAHNRLRNSYPATAIENFAHQIDIDPSLVLARLQREGLIPWNSAMNKQFKRKMQF